LPFRLNALAEMGLAGAPSKAVMGALENGAVNYEMMEKKTLHFRRIRASFSQKWIVPSEPVPKSEHGKESSRTLRVDYEPQVENVPCTGWKEISFTEYTRA
jgi:hypothetical protein